MTHPLVIQLQFAREKWLEGLVDLTPEEGNRRFGRMNSISWMLAHLGHFEQWSWLELAGHDKVTTVFDEIDVYKPDVNPPYELMLAAWQQVVDASNPLLEAMTADDMLVHHQWKGKRLNENVGTRIQRHTAHYWYHNGEASAIRQLIDDRPLPQMVGRIPDRAAFERNA